MLKFTAVPYMLISPNNVILLLLEYQSV